MTPAPIHSSHRNIINVIDSKWRDGAPFAIWEVVTASSMSTSSVTRTLLRLMELKLVSRRKKGYQRRHYRVTSQWITKDEVIQAFHWAAVLDI